MKSPKKTEEIAHFYQILENANCKIFYKVKHQIIHNDEHRKSTTLVDHEEFFIESEPIEARRQAFTYAKKLSDDSKIDGVLYEGHIDSDKERKSKFGRDYTFLMIYIICVGNFDQVYKTFLSLEPLSVWEDDLIDSNFEFEQYQYCGYDIGVGSLNVQDKEGKTYEIISPANNDFNDSIYCFIDNDQVDQVKTTGILAGHNGCIPFITSKEIAQESAWFWYKYSGECVLVELSIRGITGIIKPSIDMDCPSEVEFLSDQERIDPMFIKNIQIIDSQTFDDPPELTPFQLDVLKNKNQKL